MLKENDQVRMQPIDGREDWSPAKVVEQVPNNPRSYIVADESGRTFRRDRAFLRKKPDSDTHTPNGLYRWDGSSRILRRTVRGLCSNNVPTKHCFSI